MAFVHAGGPGDATTLRVLPVAGGTQTTVRGTPVEAANTTPSWSHDGSRLFYTSGPPSPYGDPPVARQVVLATGVDTRLLPRDDGQQLSPAVVEDVAPPTACMTSPEAAVPLGSAVGAAWTGTDAGSRVASYDVRCCAAAWNRGFGGYTCPAAWQRITGTSVTLPPVAGREYCFSVRARDAYANTSRWTADRCTTAPLDGRSLTASGSRKSSGRYDKGTYTRLASSGATVTRSGASGSRVSVVATTCPTCGSVKVHLAGRYLGTVSLSSPTTHYRHVRTRVGGSVLTGPSPSSRPRPDRS